MGLVAQSCLTLCDLMDCTLPGSSVHGDTPRKNTGVVCHALLQGIFPTQGSKPGVLHCRQILLPSELPGKPSKKQMSFDFMSAATICSDFGGQENILSLFPLFPHPFTMKWWDRMPWSLFSECWVLSQLFHSPLSPSSRDSLVPLCFLP